MTEEDKEYFKIGDIFDGARGIIMLVEIDEERVHPFCGLVLQPREVEHLRSLKRGQRGWWSIEGFRSWKKIA